MKLGIKHFFLDYQDSIKENILILTEEQKRYTASKEYLINALVPYKHYIDWFTNIDYDKIQNLDKPLPSYAIKTFSSQIGLNIDYLKYIINGIIENNRTLQKIENNLETFRDCKVSEKVFRKVLCTFNTKVSDEIIYKGYQFKIGFRLGTQRIRKVKCGEKKFRINWGESNKLKKQIIERGGTPFEVIERDLDGKALRDNNGEKWFVYFPNTFDYLWFWNKHSGANAKNIAYYRFRPTYYNGVEGGSRGNINKLKTLVTTNSELLANFKE